MKMEKKKQLINDFLYDLGLSKYDIICYNLFLIAYWLKIKSKIYQETGPLRIWEKISSTTRWKNKHFHLRAVAFLKAFALVANVTALEKSVCFFHIFSFQLKIRFTKIFTDWKFLEWLIWEKYFY